MANQPSLIPSAWAANNSTTETIPATTTESGKASWDQGFPVETSLPLSEGGIPPKYGDFNGVLNVLSQFCLFAQAGGQYAWSNTLDYSVGSIVLGTDGSIYRAAQVSGPSTTAVNPVGDTSGKWERIVSQSDINALEQEISDAMDTAEDAASNASAAQSAVTTLDANVVKLSGNQEIGGNKTFKGYVYGDTSEFRIANNKSGSTGQTAIYGGSGYSTGAYITLNGISQTSYPGQFYLTATDGTNYKTFRGYPNGDLKWDGKSFVFTSGDQTIAGDKTFSNNATFNADIGAHNINPKQNNTYALGYASARWKEIWCNQSSLNTSSDERIKQQIADVPDSVLDAWGDVDWIQFKYNDSVAEKGADVARLHNGLISQRVDEVFKAHGLDASKYGLFLYDEWETGDAYGLRYTEALCMEAAYQRRRAERAEARITTLEQRLGELEAVLASLISPISDEQTAEQEEPVIEETPAQEGEGADA